MLQISAFHPVLEPYLPNKIHYSTSQNPQTLKEITQLHALSVKTCTLHNPSVSSKFLAFYTHPKINNVHYAQSIFKFIKNPSLFCYNTLIKCFVENQRSQEALLLFQELLSGSCFLPDDFTLPCVIKACSRLSAVEEGKMIHGLCLKLGFGLDMYVESSLVSLYSKCGVVENARKVFDKMSKRDLVCWNALMDGYFKCGEIEVAMELFDQMPERDAFSWTVLIDGLSKSGRIEEARAMFDTMPVRNLASWNAMINGYMKFGDTSLALDLFNQMETRNIITWNSMIAGYAMNEKYLESLGLFSAMLSAGVKPNQATLVGTLSAISGLASLDKGRWLHSYMIKNGCQLDGVLGTVLIEMYSKCGCIGNARKVFRAIPKKKLGHWTAMIVGYGMHGMGRHALDLFNEMRRNGVKPNAVTFVGVLNACNHVGLVDDGKRYFDMMKNEYGIQPTVEHYGCLVDILCRAGHLEKAKSIIENMSVKPNKVIWMSLLGGAKIHRNLEIGEYAAKRLIEISPDTVQTYVLLSNMYAVAGQWSEVSQIREMMKRRGVRKEAGQSSMEHKGVLHKFMVGHTSHPDIEEIHAKLIEMKEKLRCSGHVADTSQVLLYVEGEKEKEAELDNHSERLAIAFGLINVKPGTPIRIVKNLRVCNDCHTVTKLLSKIYDREIVVRDNSRFHHFKNGSCSCNDYW